MPRGILIASGLLLAISAIPLFRPHRAWPKPQIEAGSDTFAQVRLPRGADAENLFPFEFAGRKASLVEDLSSGECIPRYRLFAEDLFEPFDPGISGYRITALAITDLDRDGNPELAITQREPCGGGGLGSFALLEYTDGKLQPHHLPAITEREASAVGGELATEHRVTLPAGHERFRVTHNTVEVSFMLRPPVTAAFPNGKLLRTLVYGFGADGFCLLSTSDAG